MRAKSGPTRVAKMSVEFVPFPSLFSVCAKSALRTEPNIFRVLASPFRAQAPLQFAVALLPICSDDGSGSRIAAEVRTTGMVWLM